MKKKVDKFDKDMTRLFDLTGPSSYGPRKKMTKEEAREAGLTGGRNPKKDLMEEINKAGEYNKDITRILDLTGMNKRQMSKAEARKLGLTGRKKAKTKKMAGGGKVMKYNMGGKVPTYAGMPMMAEGGVVPKKKKKKVSKKKSIDGIARQGRTRGRMV